jgi:hypothetical protein
LARRRDPPHARTPVTPSYRSTQNVRRFLHAECGAGFKFDRPFVQWNQGRHAKDDGRGRRRMAPAPGRRAVNDDASTLPVPIGAEICADSASNQAMAPPTLRSMTLLVGSDQVWSRGVR